MKVLVTGAGGQLGAQVVQELQRRQIQCIPTSRKPLTPEQTGWVQLDITNARQCLDVVQAAGADVIIHTAAWTAVDDAEDAENREKVFAVNVKGSENIARAAQSIGSHVIYISTDYVFSGDGNAPWLPEEQHFDPVNIYGQSKLAGERAVQANCSSYCIVRTSWVFANKGKNFVDTMLSLSQKYDKLRVVNDQIGRPCYAPDLARLLADMAQAKTRGIFHAANAGPYISWYEFACAIFQQAGIDMDVQPVTSEEYGLSKARRPFNSRLDTACLAKAGFDPLPDWQDALQRYLAQRKDDACVPDSGNPSGH